MSKASTTTLLDGARQVLGPALLTATVCAVAATAVAKSFDFEDSTVGQPPASFTTALTGKGRPGVWLVIAAEDAPSGSRVLAQTDADRTSYRFPVIVANDFSAKNVELSVRFKAVSGKVDQAAGLVWRYRDADNYYIARANALEGNVVLYKVEQGKRTDLPLKGKGRTYGASAPVRSQNWQTLRLVAVGSLQTVYLDGKQLYEVDDSTFAGPGRVGLWTKADSVTWFDDLEVRALE